MDIRSRHALAFLFTTTLAMAETHSGTKANDNILVLVSSKSSEKTTKTHQVNNPETNVNQGVTSLAAPNVTEADIRPHRATYAIRLGKAYDPEITSVAGTMTVEIYDHGEGWTYEHHINMNVYGQDGNKEELAITIASWEAKDFSSYHFNSLVLRNGKQEQQIKGKATHTKDGHINVEYTEPETMTVSLPGDTNFPLQHTSRLIQDAIQGKHINTAQVFDGANETHDAVSINTIITPMPKPNVNFSDKVDFSSDRLWLMHLAVYAQDSENSGPDPDYETSQRVLPHGILASMTLNFGDFDAQLTLTELDMFTHT